MQRLATRTPLLWAVLAWSFAVTVARAIRMPNDFSEAYWLLDYRFGFMKRGLIGSLSSIAGWMFGFTMSPRIIVVLSAIASLGLCAALLHLQIRSLRDRPGDRNAWLMALVFATSPFVVMNAHLFGYFDALLYVLTIGAVSFTLSDRPLLGALVLVVAMLTHESVVAMGFPLVCLAVLERRELGTLRAAQGRYLAALCIPPLTFVAMTVLQSAFTDSEILRLELWSRLNWFEFVDTRSELVAEWQVISFFELFDRQALLFGERLTHPLLVSTVGPPLLAILYFAHASFGLRPGSRSSLALLGAVCFPLLLHPIAWDTARVTTYTLGGAFIACWILSETRKPGEVGDLFALVTLPALILNVFTQMPLMDEEVERFSGPMRLVLYLPTLVLAFTLAARSGLGSSREGEAALGRR